MKAFDSLEKDSLILLSILNEDLPALMKALSATDPTDKKEDSDFSFASAFKNNKSNPLEEEEDLSQNFAHNMVYMHGVAHKMELDFDGTRKYFKNELKSLVTPAQWSALQHFFDTFTDKVAISEAENKKNIVYATTFAYRFLYNLYFLSENKHPDTVSSGADWDEEETSDESDSENANKDYLLMPGFNPLSMPGAPKNSPEKAVEDKKLLSPKEKIKALLKDGKDNSDNSDSEPEEGALSVGQQVLMSSKNISILKSLIAPGQDTFVQKSFVEMSEIFYYLPSLKSIGLHFDEFREALTHGITGCFLLEEDNEKKSLALSKNLTLEQFFKPI